MPNTTAVPDLPALPKAFWSNDIGDCYTEGQMREYALAAIATQPAPSGDAVEVLREALGNALGVMDAFSTQSQTAKTCSIMAREALATTSRAATVAKDGGEVDAELVRKFKANWQENIVPLLKQAREIPDSNELILWKQRALEVEKTCQSLVAALATPKPEASAANQQAGEVASNLLWKAEPDVYGGGKLTVNGSTIALIPRGEANRIACEHNDALRRLAAPISEGTATQTNSSSKSSSNCPTNMTFGVDNAGKPVLNDRAPAACNGDALPPLPTLRDTQFAYSADQMRAYVLADRAARAGTGSAGSIDDDKKFCELVHAYVKTVPTGAAAMLAMKADRVHAWNALVAFIDTRATKVEAAPGNAGDDTYEHRYARMEAERIAVSDAYFTPRPLIDTPQDRNVFEAGFQRGYDAAMCKGNAGEGVAQGYGDVLKGGA